MGRHESERANGGASARELETGPKFRSVRRVFKIIDLVGRRGEDLTAKQLAREVETSLSNCYYLLHILVEEGYIERVPKNGGYRLGPAIGALKQNARSDLDATIEPVVAELAQRASRNVYTAVLSDGEVTVTQVKAPPDGPPVGITPGFQGATHALALGKVLLAGEGSAYVDDYVDDHGLEAFTPRTITQPALLHAQLNKARMVGLATDFEEFALNLCCVAAPVLDTNGRVEGAIGLSTTPRRIREEGQRHLIELVQWAGREASALMQAGR
jgi:IclR family transcriptional regulator, acetate operon repressor